jgi:hypothetical protein
MGNKSLKLSAMKAYGNDGVIAPPFWALTVTGGQRAETSFTFLQLYLSYPFDKILDRLQGHILLSGEEKTCTCR